MKIAFATIAFAASFAIPAFASAQEVATTTINARVLPIVWYSDLAPDEGNPVRVYAGVQNNSGRSFSGVMAFYADGAEIGRSPFSSASGSLAEASVEWLPSAGGSYSIHAAALADLPSGFALVSSETEKDRLKVSHVVTFESVKETALAVATKVTEKGDALARALADSIEEKRQEVAAGQKAAEQASASVSASAGTSEGDVLGISTERDAPTQTSPYVASVYGAGLGAASFLLEKWRWVICIASVLVLYLIFKR